MPICFKVRQSIQNSYVSHLFKTKDSEINAKQDTMYVGLSVKFVHQIVS